MPGVDADRIHRLAIDWSCIWRTRVIMIRVDAHHHVWRLDRGDYGWITPGMSIHRDYSLDDLRPIVADAIDATVLVQAAPTDAETDYLLEVARESQGFVK